jgi:hypothetical protein
MDNNVKINTHSNEKIRSASVTEVENDNTKKALEYAI